ncbi:MAG: hypothetical protein JNL38_24725 [Myxococcales bacterium]|nr:hypothetical protein [Myxococcales bacterium]
MVKKGLGDKVIGWFIVREDDGAVASTAEPEASAADEAVDVEVPGGSAPPAPAPARLTGAPLVPPGKAHDTATFRGVYRAAGVADEAYDRVEKALALVASLPESTPVEVRRTIVEASLKAFGVPVDGILDAASAELGALDAYVAEGDKRTREIELDAKARVERLTREIAEIQRLVELQRATHGELVRATANERDRVGHVFDFFGRDAEPLAAGDKKLRLVR